MFCWKILVFSIKMFGIYNFVEDKKLLKFYRVFIDLSE